MDGVALAERRLPDLAQGLASAVPVADLTGARSDLLRQCRGRQDHSQRRGGHEAYGAYKADILGKRRFFTSEYIAYSETKSPILFQDADIL